MAFEDILALIDKDKYKVRKKKIKRNYRPETIEKMKALKLRHKLERKERLKASAERRKLRVLATARKHAEAKRLAKRQKKIERALELERLAQLGYRKGYTSSDPTKPRKNSRDRDLCRTIYFKAMNGMTTRQIANEYDRPYNWVYRHKFEYEYYLTLVENREKGEDNDPEAFWTE